MFELGFERGVDRGFKRWFKRLLILGLALMALGASVLYFVTQRDLLTVPEDLVGLTKAQVKPQLLDRAGRPLTVTYRNQWNAHDQQSLHRIPDFLQQAFILAEDKRFYSHGGVDWKARLMALVQNVLALEGVRGASTISEQVVRMIHPRPRSVWARWLEGWEAQRLEAKFDKATIFEFYLNQVPYAAQRRGVQQAASYYFDRDVSTLSHKEMLALAVLVRAPSRFDLYKSTQRLEGRLSILAERAINAKQTTQEQIGDQPLTVSRPEPMLNVRHFAKHVYQRADLGKHQIKTTLNSRLQNAAQTLLDERVADLRNKNVHHGGMLIVDYQTDEVLAWAIADVHEAGSAFDTIKVKRQPGSTLKPFVYASALEKGWTAATMIDDSPFNEGVGQGVHSYRNYSNTFYGKLSLRQALGNSLNIPAIKATRYVGVEPLLKKFGSLGINDLDLRSVDYGSGLALGNGEISLYSLVGAYASLARGGRYRALRDTQASSLKPEVSVFSPEVSSLVTNILSDPEARSLEFGRGGTLHLPVQTAVKTGTSNDYRDAWVVGFNHRYVVGVWMGNLDSQPMDNVTGSIGPALVMRAMFSELNKAAETKPLYLSRKLIHQDVCIDSGLLSNGECATRKEWFLPNRLPKQEVQRTQKPAYRIAQPVDQMHVARDPRIPDESEALEFKLNNSEQVARVNWFVNNILVASTQSSNYLWPLQAGRHTVKAEVFGANTDTPNATQQVSFVVK